MPRLTRRIKGEIEMGIKGWYLTEGEKADSGYTEFNKVRAERPDSSYTDFTASNMEEPGRKRTVRKAAVKNAPVSSKKKKKSSAGKKFLCIFGVIAILLGAGAWYYFDSDNVEDILMSGVAFDLGAKSKRKDNFSDNADNTPAYELKGFSEKTPVRGSRDISYNESSSVYEIAESIVSSLRCDNDVDTAWEIFNWVHSNIYYQAIYNDMSFEDAAYRGFTRKSGDCFVYFACSKMLLDCAGIPNMMVERYPVITNGHYWNLVQLDGEWYHCDAAVFKDHAGMYFMCTDEEIGDEHHSFDGSLYPERASGYSGYFGSPDYSGYSDIQPGVGYDISYDEDYYDEVYTEEDFSEEDYSDFYIDEFYEEDYSDFYGEDWEDFNEEDWG